MRLLLINPNTSTHITDRLARSARGALHDQRHADRGHGGRRHRRSCATQTTCERADANALALAHRHAAQHDAIVLAISLDRAVVAMRQQLSGPAGRRHDRGRIADRVPARRADRTADAGSVGIAPVPGAGGADRCRLARGRLCGARGAHRRSPQVPTTSFREVCDVLAGACDKMRHAGAQVIVLAGAVLCGYADALQARCALPVLDGVDCAVRQLRVLGRLDAATD